MRLHRWRGHLAGKVALVTRLRILTVGFVPNRLRMNVYYKEVPGSLIFMDPAAEDEGTSTLFRRQMISVKTRCRKTSGRTSLSSRTDTGNAVITLASWLPSCSL